MVTCFNILYSASAVRRLLGLSGDVGVQIREFFKVVWVWVVGKRPTFMSKRVFKQHFVYRRKAAALTLSVTQHSDSTERFTVCNEAKSTAYLVECRADGVFCTCDDFSNQLQFFGRGCCKHGYAALSSLGFSSLAEYLAV